MIVEENWEQIASVCKEVAKACKIVASCLYGSRVCGYARKDSDYDVLLILEGFDEGVRYFYMEKANIQLAILAADKKAVEADARRGALGDFIVGRLTSPYVPIFNSEFLKRVEIETKRRFAKEDLEDLIIEYGELSRGLVVKPEYLVLARMRKRSRAYPPLRYSYINMLQTDLRERNMQSILDGYFEAIRGMANAKLVKFNGDNILLENSYIDDVLSVKTAKKVVNLFEFSRKALSAYATHGKAGKVNLDVVTKELASKIKRELKVVTSKQELGDPKNYVFLKTQDGLINLSEKQSITKIIREVKGEDRILVNSLGGALSEVYLVQVGTEKLVVKKFTDWFNFKWFALGIVAYGTKTFTLSGKTRLSNEYGINHLLSENYVQVPKIVSINIQEHLLIERFIEGTSILDIIKEAAITDDLKEEHKKLAFEVGKMIAKIHGLDIALGDCKPENFIVSSSNNKIYILDLEQGERKGDKVWDIAEFCYFSGHYGNVLTGGLHQFIKSFIEGYAQMGDKKILRKAAELGYSRVFFVWTSMHNIHEISNLLKRT